MIKGKCVCKPEFGDKSTLSTPDWICEACGTNIASCTFSATGKAVTACKAGFFMVGTMDCKAKDATDVNGFYFDTASSTFKACNATCLKCTGATAANCSACPEAPATWKEPVATDANFATYIKGTRALINNTCYSDCPANFVANTAKTNCVAKAAAAASNGFILSIVALVASLLIIF